MGEVNRVICGDARDVLKAFPDEYFQTTITSPPYCILAEKRIAETDVEADNDEEKQLDLFR